MSNKFPQKTSIYLISRLFALKTQKLVYKTYEPLFQGSYKVVMSENTELNKKMIYFVYDFNCDVQ